MPHSPLRASSAAAPTPQVARLDFRRRLGGSPPPFVLTPGGAGGPDRADVAAIAARLASALRYDAVVRAARPAWPALDRDERLLVAARIAALQALAFRFAPAPMEVEPDDAPLRADLARFDPAAGRISIAAWVADHADPRALFDAVLRAQFEAYAHQRARDAATAADDVMRGLGLR
jgi:hypothetical protein